MRADVPAFLEALVDNGALDALDTDGLFNDSKNTCTLARGGAHPSSEFGEVCTRIGFGQGMAQAGKELENKLTVREQETV